jgi:drug/metabolite transporter (DMT)-like permease
VLTWADGPWQYHRMILASYYGELAAFGAAAGWAGCSIAFTKAGRDVGSLCVNIIRLAMAGLFLLAVGGLCYGQWLPEASGRAWCYLGLSGVLGFFVGDICLFKAFLLIGPRLSVLIMALWPPFAALIARGLLDERLNPWQWLGMGITLAGIGVAVMAREQHSQLAERRHYGVGILLAAIGALGQASGYVVADLGMNLLDPSDAHRLQVSFQAAQIRLLAAMVCFVVLFTVMRRWPRLVSAVKQRRAMGWLTVGAAIGPFLGVVCSLVAIRYIESGVASTIIATAPILVLLYAVLVEKERVTPLTVIATVTTVLGVALLLLAG